MFIAALFPTAECGNNPGVRQQKNGLQNVVDTHNTILFSHKKEWNFGICYNMMNPEHIMLSEISQAEEDKYCTISPIWGTWNSKFLETESRIDVIGVWGEEGRGGYCLIGTEVFWRW